MCVGEVVEKMLEASKRKAREKCVNNKKFDVAIDCRWSSCGFNAEERTVTCCDIKSEKVMYHSHLMCESKIQTSIDNPKE